MATPSIALIPTGTKAGTLYSVLPEDGSGDFTVVRATTATRVNENGLIESVANNVPRLDYTNGGCPVLLTEPQSTQLITYPLSFDNAYWTKDGTTVVSGQTSPSADSPTGAFKLVEDTSGGHHRMYASINGVSKTFSIYAKYIDVQYLGISYDGGTNFSFFDILNGQLGTLADSAHTSVITYLSNGWYRCSVYNNDSSFGTLVALSKDGITTSYVGDGTSGAYIFGTQLEALSYPTSLMLPLTEGSTTTRNADQVTDSGDVNDFNSTEGVLMLEMSRLNKSDTSSIITSINDGSLTNTIALYYNSGGIAYDILNSAGERSGSFSMSTNNQSNLNKIALKYKSQDISLFVNGFEVDTNVGTLSLSGLNTLELNHGNGAFNFYGKTKQIQVFKSALTSLEIETLTSWTSFILMANAQEYLVY